MKNNQKAQTNAEQQQIQPIAYGDPTQLAEELETVSSCCSVQKQVVCCQPAKKAACCGQSKQPGGCGCQSPVRQGNVQPSVAQPALLGQAPERQDQTHGRRTEVRDG